MDLASLGMLCSALVIHLICNDFGCHFLLVVDRRGLWHSEY